MTITFYGHGCFGFAMGGKQVLIDPFISPNPKAEHINVEEIPADYLLLTHGHQDHVADVEHIAKRTGAKLVSNFEVIGWFGQKGLENAHPMNHGGKASFDFGTVKYVNAVHSSNMPDGSYGGNPGGFLIESEGKTFYFSGDTALHYDMKLIGEFYKLDFACLCIGDNFTMGPEDALIAADFINCQEIIGMHYDTFGYIEIDHAATQQMFADRGKTLHLMGIGDTLDK